MNDTTYTPHCVTYYIRKDGTRGRIKGAFTGPTFNAPWAAIGWAEYAADAQHPGKRWEWAARIEAVSAVGTRTAAEIIKRGEVIILKIPAAERLNPGHMVYIGSSAVDPIAVYLTDPERGRMPIMGIALTNAQSFERVEVARKANITMSTENMSGYFAKSGPPGVEMTAERLNDDGTVTVRIGGAK